MTRSVVGVVVIAPAGESRERLGEEHARAPSTVKIAIMAKNYRKIDRCEQILARVVRTSMVTAGIVTTEPAV